MRKLLYLASFDFTRDDHFEKCHELRLVVVTQRNVEQMKQKYPEWEKVLQERHEPWTNAEGDAAYVLAAQWFKKRYPDGNAYHVQVKAVIESEIDDTDISCKTPQDHDELNKIPPSITEYAFNTSKLLDATQGLITDGLINLAERGDHEIEVIEIGGVKHRLSVSLEKVI